MSDKHLSAGSVEPPRVKGLLRVYSMKSCPFAERARLVLKVKNLPHDIVNIDLHNKPEWYFKIHPKGQVPALLDGDKIIIESLDIADYLDEKYPTNNPLYPSESASKKKDQDIIRNYIGEPAKSVSMVQYSKEPYTVEKALEILLPSAQPLEDELKRRGTPYFGGDKPGMIDYMLWPFAERTVILPDVLGVEKLPLKDDQIPHLRKWAKTMLQDPTVKETVTRKEVFLKVIEAKKNNTFNYAEIFNEQ